MSAFPAHPDDITDDWWGAVLGRVPERWRWEAIGTGQVGDSVRFTLDFGDGAGPVTLAGKFAAADPTSRGTAAMRIEGRPYTTIERVLVQRMIEVVLHETEREGFREALAAFRAGLLGAHRAHVERRRAQCLGGTVLHRVRRGLPGVVQGHHAMADADIHWLAPFRSQTPRRIRLLVDFLVERFSHEPWKPARPASSAKRARPNSLQKR